MTLSVSRKTCCRVFLKCTTPTKSGYRHRHGIRRVVVTGRGVVSCLGVGADIVWQRLLKGRCGITSLDGKEYDGIPCRVAGLIPRGDKSGQLNIDKVIEPSKQRTMSEGSMYVLVAAEEALNDARWKPVTEEDKIRTGVAIGMGLVGMKEIYQTKEIMNQKGYKGVHPHFLPKILVNMAAGNVSVKFGLKGPNHAVSTACTTGLHSIGDACRFIQHGDADVMIAGGTEESPNPLSVAGFSKMRALSTRYNDNPKQASRPFDRKRDGFIMSEGAAVLVLEEISHALNRGATIYAEILGYGLSGDGHHITAPSEDGNGAYRCMNSALNDAQVESSQIEYVNAHATSTPLGDMAESKAIMKCLGGNSNLRVSSTKGATGHLLGAAGSIETLFTVMSCYSGKVPATLNLHEPDTGIDLNYIANDSVDWTSKSSKRIALTNSFGFGGTNGCLCISSFIQ
ncbi:3-oxoacyl-[acyl-carrier-protein] synthase, mitochondrial-like [Mytilus trossulus]|uniref:3-oxoacyl-[acyl-carrier-protein] synthase, mitochondrial-like n=1 Tax=Mytilus trossulus TaxID=6551 RepID=UPI00300712AA